MIASVEEDPEQDLSALLTEYYVKLISLRMDKNIKRFLSVDKIYSTYEKTKILKRYLVLQEKLKLVVLEPGKKKDKTDSIMRVLLQYFYTRKRIW